GYLFAFAGVLGIILQGGLLGRLVKRYGEFKLTIFAFIAALIAYSLIGFATTLAMVIVATIVNAFGQGVLRPVLTARLTQALDHRHDRKDQRRREARRARTQGARAHAAPVDPVPG